MTAEQRRAAKLSIAKRLYRSMPGAPVPPSYGGDWMWGEIEGSDHWHFCDSIAQIIIEEREMLHSWIDHKAPRRMP